MSQIHYVNLGGGRGNSCSILEAFERIGTLSGRKMAYEYVDENREGDHICYTTNLKKFRSHYPKWKVTRGLDTILEEIIDLRRARQTQPAA